MSKISEQGLKIVQDRLLKTMAEAQEDFGGKENKGRMPEKST